MGTCIYGFVFSIRGHTFKLHKVEAVAVQVKLAVVVVIDKIKSIILKAIVFFVELTVGRKIQKSYEFELIINVAKLTFRSLFSS